MSWEAAGVSVVSREAAGVLREAASVLREAAGVSREAAGVSREAAGVSREAAGRVSLEAAGGHRGTALRGSASNRRVTIV